MVHWMRVYGTWFFGSKLRKLLFSVVDRTIQNDSILKIGDFLGPEESPIQIGDSKKIGDLEK